MLSNLEQLAAELEGDDEIGRVITKKIRESRFIDASSITKNIPAQKRVKRH